MEEQGRKLMRMLDVAVRSLDRVESISPVLKSLGASHVSYGVRPEHYDVVGAALLWTLRQALGEAFTPEVEEAWTATYGLVAGVMRDA